MIQNLPSIIRDTRPSMSPPVCEPNAQRAWLSAKAGVRFCGLGTKHFILFTYALLAISFVWIVPAAQAQNINTPENFPDAVFRNAIASFMGVGIDDPFTSAQAAAKTGTLDVSSAGISSVSGIQFFTGLTSFYCRNNQLIELDLPQSTNLQYLFCNGNQLTELDVSNCPNLRFLYCYDNDLAYLDLTGNSALTHLQCQRNSISSLVISASASVINLNAFLNQITDISSLAANGNWGAGTAVVDIRFNNVSCASWDDIQVLEQRLGSVFYYSPQNNLDMSECIGTINTPSNFPDSNFRAAAASFMGVGLNDPYTASEAAAKTGTFNVSGSNIENVTGIEYFTGISVFYCRNNLLQNLDVSHNTNLQYLFCDNNNLTSLDVSSNPNLRFLYCYDNDLNALDLSGNDALTHLQCQRNSLQSLEVSQTASFVNINAFLNHIADITTIAANSNWGAGTTVVDLRYNDLDCEDWDNVLLLEQQLTDRFLYSPQNSLNPYECIENINTAANFLDANFRAAVASFMGVGINDPFTASEAAAKTGTLNVSGLNIASMSGIEFFSGITALYCQNNQLTALDVSGNVSLQYLFCNGNQIVNLDVSANPNLRFLYCYDNQLPSLDLSGNDAITHIQCQRNNITNLSVSADASLLNVNAFRNQLDDISSLAANPNWSAGTIIVDVRFNNLSENDLADIDLLEQQLGGRFYYTVNDTLPPVITCPDNIVAEGQSPNGAVVIYVSPTAVDSLDPAPIVISTPVSGSLFALGDTIVECTASDASGHVSNCTFTVSVVDTTPPEIVCPDDITVNADSASGTVVNFEPPFVSDLCDPSPIVNCTPASGSTFPVGETVVECVAEDASGNQAFCSFSITVTSSNQLIIQLFDSTGEGLAGGTAQYYKSGWHDIPGSTNADGVLELAPPEGLAGTVPFRMTFAFASQQINQNITANPVVTFQTVDATLQLEDSLGQPLNGESVYYYSSGWRTFGDGTMANGEAHYELLPGTYPFRLTYAYKTQQINQNITSNPIVVFQTIPSTIELRNSADELIDEGYSVQYYSSGWHTYGDGSTNGGQVSMELLPGTYPFRLTYAYKSQQINQNIASNSTVVFQTTPATVELRNSTDELIDEGNPVKYYSSGWHTFGNGATSGGQVSMELLPGTYPFELTYAHKSQQINQNIASASTVVFQTSQTTVELRNSANELIDEGNPVKYYSSGWHTYGSGVTSGGQVSMELLPGTYPFELTYAYKSQQINQNIASNSTVVFQTVPSTVELRNSADDLIDEGNPVKYYSSGWHTYGSGVTSGGQVSMELLPGTYPFELTYAYKSRQINQNIASDPTVVFQTRNVTVELIDSSGAPLDTDGPVQYYSSGWRTFGDGFTNAGQVSMELLPGVYPFRLTYAHASQQINQDVNSLPVVIFQTGQVLDTSTVGFITKYYASGWHDFVDGMELMPHTYPFRFDDGSQQNFTIQAGTANNIPNP